jgi:hypothetical protein
MVAAPTKSRTIAGYSQIVFIRGGATSASPEAADSR